MIKIQNAVWPSSGQWKAVIHGMRNPMNSWDKSDGYVDAICWPTDNYYAFYEDFKMRVCEEGFAYCLGENDIKLAKNLINAGVEHAKFLRQLPVIMDISAPLYWWKQADQYKIGTTTDSQSTMHCLTKKPFSLDDFSLGELSDENYYIESGDVGIETNIYVGSIITTLNALRDRYIDTGEKKYWNAINRLLPQSYNQRRRCSKRNGNRNRNRTFIKINKEYCIRCSKL